MQLHKGFSSKKDFINNSLVFPQKVLACCTLTELCFKVMKCFLFVLCTLRGGCF